MGEKYLFSTPSVYANSYLLKSTQSNMGDIADLKLPFSPKPIFRKPTNNKLVVHVPSSLGFFPKHEALTRHMHQG